MNKQNLVAATARKVKKPQALVEEILLALLDEIQTQVRSGEDVTLMGFGTFFLGGRKASKGYNPHTGTRMDLPKIPLPKFRAGKGFKEKVRS